VDYVNTINEPAGNGNQQLQDKIITLNLTKYSIIEMYIPKCCAPVSSKRFAMLSDIYCSFSASLQPQPPQPNQIHYYFITILSSSTDTSSCQGKMHGLQMHFSLMDLTFISRMK
jgi:hypothetical protein